MNKSEPNQKSGRTTCGPLFSDCLCAFTDLTHNQVETFAAGHLSGQAEKIYLGACLAAMVRPSRLYRSWCLHVCTKLSAIYGLEVSVFERDEIADEIWIHKPEARPFLEELNALEVNSRLWHHIRGFLCGIPAAEIDTHFHTRQGYQEVCDQPDQQGRPASPLP